MFIAIFDFIAAGLVIMVAFLLMAIPTAWLLRLGRFFGSVVFIFNKKRRMIGYANMKAAYSREKTPAQIRKMLKNNYRRMVETFLEVVSLTKVNRRYTDKYVKFRNTHNFWKAYNHRDGAVMLTAHFGDWELSGMASALNGLPLYVLARDQRMKRLNELLNMLRESKGLKVVRKGITTRYIVKALHEGKMIGMVADQDAGKKGYLSPFFGRPVSTAVGPYKFAAKTGALILPTFMCRIKGPYHELALEDPIFIKKGEDIGPHIDRYNRLLESYIRRYPDHWLWLHKRWKSTPVKKILILSDGKKGHLNQSLSVAKEVENYRRRDPSYAEGTTHLEVIEAGFKNDFLKTLFNLASPFFNWRWQGRMGLFKMCLEKDSYKALIHTFADIVISCGSSMAAVNRLAAIENNAKSIAILKPGLLSADSFDIIILPRHDYRGSYRNKKHVVVTDTAPNLVDRDFLDSGSRKIRESVSFTRPFKIGVLLGGDNADFTLTGDVVSSALDNVIDASSRIDADILLTTSRRTSKDVERIVKDKLSDRNRCRFLVIPNEEDPPHALAGILGLSDVVVVSGESVSMVSEAVTAGKPTVVFKPKKKKNGETKYERMLAGLAAGKYITIAEPGGLSEAICRARDASDKPPVLNDRHKIYEQMWRVL